MHSLEMIFQVIPPSKFLAKTRAVGVETSPVKARYLVNRLFVSFSVVWGGESLGAGAVVEPAAEHLLMFLLMLPEITQLQ